MDSENKEDNSKDFGKVIDILHSKQKLPSLRTYQGDMAEFIKEKNESVISIAVKEKEEKEEKKKDNIHLIPKTSSNKEGLQVNMTILLSSILLLAGGAVAVMYIFDFLKKEPVSQVVTKTEIIPYNNLITLANLINKNLGTEIAKLSPTNGISILKISDADGFPLPKAKNLFSFLSASLPPTLERTLKDEYAVGIISQNNQTSYFLIISVNDFGRAFSGMLEWEKSMENDLSFLNIATSTGVFEWKDLIIKNKDTRALANPKNQAKMAYTFLDKNTILITNNLWTIGEMSSIYTSRPVAR